MSFFFETASKRALAIALVSLAALTSCQRSGSNGSAIQADQSAGIIGGTPVNSEDPISQVMVKILTRFDDGVVGTCSGTIISHQFLITAAHCFASREEGEVEPDRLILHNGIEASVQNVFLHPNYDYRKRFNRYDIALVRFRSANVKSFAVLPKNGESPSESKNAISFVAGFGRREVNRAESSGLLYKLPASLLAEDFEDSEQLVSGGAKSGTCFGDSGGPFYQEQNGSIKVFSVLSREAPGNTGCVGTDIQTKTVSALPWIAKVMAGEITPRPPLQYRNKRRNSNNGDRQYGL